MFARISRAQLLAVSGWSTIDLDNRVRHNQVALAFGLTLPAESGAYIGVDGFTLKLSDALVGAGFPRTLAARFVVDAFDKIWRGVERIEWPELFPPPVPMLWAPTKRSLDEGVSGLRTDCEICFAISKSPDGQFRTACGTLAEALPELLIVDSTTPNQIAPAQITTVNLRQIYNFTLETARQKGINLGAPFARPEGHPEHKDWYAAVEVHRAFALQRQRKRKPPGPTRKRGRPTREAQAMRAAASVEARKA